MLFNNRADNLAEELWELYQDKLEKLIEDPDYEDMPRSELEAEALDRAKDALDYRHNRPEAVYT